MDSSISKGSLKDNNSHSISNKMRTLRLHIRPLHFLLPPILPHCTNKVLKRLCSSSKGSTMGLPIPFLVDRFLRAKMYVFCVVETRCVESHAFCRIAVCRCVRFDYIYCSLILGQRKLTYAIDRSTTTPTASPVPRITSALLGGGDSHSDIFQPKPEEPKPAKVQLFADLGPSFARK